MTPSRSTTQAHGRSSHFGSGTPMTAHSSTAGWAITTFSRSIELTHSPPDLMTSFVRSVMRTKPRLSSVPMSPVRSQPSWNFSGVSSRWYAPVIHGPRISISPTVVPSRGATLPSLAPMRISTPGRTRPAQSRSSIWRSGGGVLGRAGERTER